MLAKLIDSYKNIDSLRILTSEDYEGYKIIKILHIIHLSETARGSLDILP